MKRRSHRLSAIVLAALLAACAADKAAYPSLARRDVERTRTPQPAPPPPPASVPDAPNLAPRLAGLVEQASKAHERFSARRGRAEQLTASARGAARASEGSAVASVALADLESARSEAMVALADLDQMFAAARIEGGDASAIAEARDKVTAWIGEEDAVLAALRERLGG